ncbi:winged helix-turn-helix domain-containing protein [Bosea sp. UC22_33]|uniref:winged helix-turn-helix domain-containing protein n=1 Tax=Bosea sp. UC22_33 TaxID=3350165 RepID=UPI00366C9D3A
MTIHAQASKLDMDKFAKVHRLITAGATEGERTAARARAEAIAQRAGMTLNQALSKMDSAPKPQPAAAASSDWRDIFRGMDDWMEEKHPGYQASQAEKNTAREERRADRRRALLERFGNVSAVFALTEIERALFVAAAPFAKRKINMDWCGTQKFAFTCNLGGAGELDFLSKADPAAVAAIREGWPMPQTLPGLLAEALMWDKLHDDRSAFVEGEYRHHLEVFARMELLERDLHNRPAESWDDVESRFAWEKHKFERQWIDPTEEKEDGLVMTLRRDFEMLRRRYEAPAQNGQDEACAKSTSTNRRTNADKQHDVISLLNEAPHLSDREIGRPAGVSPQTVSTWRKKLQAQCPS